jgi:hypothetical protein
VKAGKIISAKIAEKDGVVGILGSGAVGRGFGDSSSDLDLLVYAEKKHVPELTKLISIGWIGYRGVDYDFEVIDYEKAMNARVPSKTWTQIKRWDHQNAQILYDSVGRMKKLLAEKVIYPDSERKRLMKKYKMLVHEHLVFFPEMWANRGRLYNVVDTLYRGVEYLILWIYAKNRLFEPYVDKWLFYHLENKALPEHKHLKKLTGIYTISGRGLKQVMQIREKLLNICLEVGLTFEVYSFGEARERTKRNWRKLSDRSKKFLSW